MDGLGKSEMRFRYHFPIRKPVSLFVFLVVFNHLLSTVVSVAIDNDVQGEPVIECGDNALTFSVKTRKLFAGRIFVKGKTTETTCMRADFARQQTSTPAFDLSFGACGMRGQRAEEPRGMFYSVTLVVSFHPMFVTKVDRAYHVKCFFEEALRTLTAGIDVSMISTADVTAFRSSTGLCTYTIHQGTVAGGAGNIGPPVSVAQVGDKIVHKWECTDAMYGILVRSCYVTDGFGTQAEVIDRRGCPVDPVLISGISYDSSLTQAFAESHVFKFADRPGVWFYCQLQMCLKMSQACEGLTPPSCGMMPQPGPGGSGGTMPSWYNRTTPTGGTGTRRPSTGATATSGSGSGSTVGSLPPGTRISTPPTGAPVNGTAETAIIPEESPPPEAGTEIPRTPGVTPPPGYRGSTDASIGASTGASVATSTNTLLPPAPPWSSTANVTGSGPSAGSSAETPAAAGGSTGQVHLSTFSSVEPQTRSPPVPSGYSKDTASGEKKQQRVLIRQRVDDDRSTASTMPAVYEEEELIYDESGMDEEEPDPSSTAAPSDSPRAATTGQVPGARKWKRPPSPTAGSVDRAITYKGHRRPTGSVTRTIIKRAPTSTQEIDSEIDDENRPTSRRYQEIEKKMRRPVSPQNRKRFQQQQRRLLQQKRKKLPNAGGGGNAENENEETFMYRDSELSNRLIIFDVDEDPPPDYMHWARNKPSAGPDRDDEAFISEQTVGEKKEANSVGGATPRQTTTAAPDACIVSAQGLVMILSAFGALSLLLIIFLAVVCARYRAVNSAKRDRPRSIQRPAPSSESDNSESADRARRANAEKSNRWQHQHQQQRTSSSSVSDIELPRLPRPQERRKQR